MILMGHWPLWIRICMVLVVTWTSLGNLWSPRCSLCKEVASCWRELILGQSNSLDLSQSYIISDDTTLVQNKNLSYDWKKTCYVCDYLPFLELFAFEDLNIRQPEGRHKVSWAHETPVLEVNRFRLKKHETDRFRVENIRCGKK